MPNWKLTITTEDRDHMAALSIDPSRDDAEIVNHFANLLKHMRLADVEPMKGIEGVHPLTQDRKAALQRKGAEL